LINSQPRIEKEDLQGIAPAPEGEICRKTAKFNVILGAWPSGIIKHGRQSDSSHHPEIPILIIISPLLIAYIYIYLIPYILIIFQFFHVKNTQLMVLALPMHLWR
jgi:hypothetical protein